tara:strand:- start:17820 stop:18068 length:249 start_codon:yes stop_codon:yes gene_type:complete
MTTFNNLPDEVVHIIYMYSNAFLEDIPKWNKNKKKWNPLISNKCYKCNMSSSIVALAHICNCCSNNSSGVCKNELICWSCAH